MSVKAIAPGRPREFAIEDAVRDALEVFRARGYEGASMVDLLEGTGLSRGSLYKAFPDKHALFMAAFDLYADEAVARLRDMLSAANAREAVRNALLHYAHSSASACWQRGCLIATANAELPPDDAEARARVAAIYARLQALWAGAVRRGQEAGVFARGLNPDALGRLFLSVVQGLRVLGKAGMPESELREVASTAMLALGRA
jgi:TetR/AcrR family transcriptional repressor of nem operon